MKFNGRWLPDFEEYRKECLKIAQELRESPGGSRFKQNPIYKKIINNDNRSRGTAEAFYKYIKDSYPVLLYSLSEFKHNDSIGYPTMYHMGGIAISPGTLRFVKVLGDLIKFEAINYWNGVVEIGGGYGGQANIIISHFDSQIAYALVDIPESLEVAKAYLSAMRIGAYFESCEAIEKREYDLVISDYCISEMNREGIDFYFDNVIKYCKAGYFTCNKIGETDYLIERLKEVFTLEIVPEFPKTSKHDNIIIYARKIQD